MVPAGKGLGDNGSAIRRPGSFSGRWVQHWRCTMGAGLPLGHHHQDPSGSSRQAPFKLTCSQFEFSQTAVDNPFGVKEATVQQATRASATQASLAPHEAVPAEGLPYP